MMKRFLVFGLMMALCFSAFAPMAFGQEVDYSDPLYDAIRQHSITARHDDDPPGNMVVVVFTDYPALADLIFERYKAEYEGSKYTLIDHRQEFPNEGYIIGGKRSRRAHEIAKAFGAEYVSYGTLVRRGNDFRLEMIWRETTVKYYNWYGDARWKYQLPYSGAIAAALPDLHVETASSAGSSEGSRFKIGAAYSMYNPAWLDFGEIEPARFKADMNHNLHLMMDLKFFRNISAFVDLSVDDWTFERAINIAGALGTKYFTIQIDRRSGSGNLSYWDVPDAGEIDKETDPPDWIKKHNF